jgi:Flp pilus assembly protein TadG
MLSIWRTWRRRFQARLRTFRRDEAGVIFIIVGLSVPLIFGAAAISVDIGQLLYIQTELQTAADAAALAATDAFDDEDEAKSIAVSYAELNMPVAENGDVLNPDDVILGNWDDDAGTFSANSTPTNAVRVTLRRATANDNAVPMYFARLIGFDTRDVEVMAIAFTSLSDDNFCILALDPDGAGAVTLNGTPALTMPNCGLAVASSDDSALIINGNGDLEASEICVTGGSSVGPQATVNPGVTDDCSNIPDDPLAELPAPDIGDCDQTNFQITGSNNNVTLQPGVYCGGITMTGNNNTITLASGEYIIDGGGISINGGTFQDDGNGGVFIYNTSSDGSDFEDITFTGNGTISLEAQTTGTYAGVLFLSTVTPTPARIFRSAATRPRR